MDDKELKNVSYDISWTQVYPYWEDMQEQLTEMALEFSDMAESRSVIDHIKSL